MIDYKSHDVSIFYSYKILSSQIICLVLAFIINPSRSILNLYKSPHAELSKKKSNPSKIPILAFVGLVASKLLRKNLSCFFSTKIRIFKMSIIKLFLNSVKNIYKLYYVYEINSISDSKPLINSISNLKNT